MCSLPRNPSFYPVPFLPHWPWRTHGLTSCTTELFSSAGCRLIRMLPQVPVRLKSTEIAGDTTVVITPSGVVWRSGGSLNTGKQDVSAPWRQDPGGKHVLHSSGVWGKLPHIPLGLHHELHLPKMHMCSLDV